MVPLRTSPGLLAVPRLRHGFTTRAGGVSQGLRATLNLALGSGAEPPAVEENWRRVLATLDPALRVGQLALLDQVHGGDVLHVTAGGGPRGVVGAADAAVTTQTGVVLAVRTADCVPVLFAAGDAIGVAHAGWRGVAAAIVQTTVRRLCELAGVGADGVIAAIGPHIGVGAYEVGGEVVRGIAATGVPEAAFVHPASPRPHVDLGAAVEAQLRAVGVEHIDRVEGCTVNDPQLYSWRRDGPETGRLAGVLVRLS